MFCAVIIASGRCRLHSTPGAAVSILELSSDWESRRRSLATLLVVNREFPRLRGLGSCLPALPKPVLIYPTFPGLLQLCSCIRKSMLSADLLATCNPKIRADMILLPNKICLLPAGKRKHPENIIQQVKHAATKDTNRLKCTVLREPAKIYFRII